MMYPRLKLLRRLLSDGGLIFVSIDENEVYNLRSLLDEIFGISNFVANFVWQKRQSPDGDEKYVTNTHDDIICYAKRKQGNRLNRLIRTEEADARYSNPDNDPRGNWTSSDLTRREYREHDFYPIILPSGREKSCLPRGAVGVFHETHLKRWWKIIACGLERTEMRCRGANVSLQK